MGFFWWWLVVPDALSFVLCCPSLDLDSGMCADFFFDLIWFFKCPGEVLYDLSDVPASQSESLSGGESSSCNVFVF